MQYVPFCLDCAWVLNCLLQKVRESELGDAVVVDVDENKIKTSFNDLEELPSEIVSSLS